VPKKLYIAYKASKNFVYIEVKRTKILMFLKVDPKEITMPSNGRDVSNIGHWGTGDLEITVKDLDEMEKAKKYIKIAFENIGG